MYFKYENNMAYLYDNENIKIEQSINPFTDSDICSEEDALTWANTYIRMMYDSSLMYFSLACDNEDVSVNEKCKITIKEGTGRLTGKYKIKIKGEREVSFIDGEAELEIVFTTPGVYEVVLNSFFYIGEEKYVAFVDQSEKDRLEVSNENNNNLTIVVK